MPVFDNTKSKIKMVILTQNKQSNAVWWSPINQNKRKSELVIRSMLRRFEKSNVNAMKTWKTGYENSLKENQDRRY